MIAQNKKPDDGMPFQGLEALILMAYIDFEKNVAANKQQQGRI